jgi:hypothetical protein
MKRHKAKAVGALAQKEATLQVRVAEAILGQETGKVAKRLNRVSLRTMNQLAHAFIGPTVQERVAKAICQCKSDDFAKGLEQVSVLAINELADVFGVKR